MSVDEGRQYEIFEVSLPSSRNLTISVLAGINGYETEAVIDSAAMITLIQEKYFRSIYTPNEWGVSVRLTGIGGEHVMGKMVHNVPFTFGDQTFLHTVCVAPIKELCLLGLDFLKATGCVLDLANDILEIAGDVFPIKVAASPELQVSRVSVAKRTVIPPNTVGYIRGNLETDIDGTYIVQPSNKKALVSRLFGHGSSVCMKVINESDKYVTFKKGSLIGHAESADLVPDAMVNCDINRCAEQNVNEAQELPEHLKKMYEDNISELSSEEKQQFKNLLIEFSDVFSKSDFDLGCLSGVEHKINTYDEIPHAEKFRRTPLQFQKAEQEYIEKLLQQGVIEPSVSEWSAAPVLVHKKTGELRYCIDYRALNAKTYKDNFSLPLIDDCMDSLYGKKLFCVLDLCSGYFQIPVEEISRHKTSFNTRFGSFQ